MALPSRQEAPALLFLGEEVPGGSSGQGGMGRSIKLSHILIGEEVAGPRIFCL